MKIAFVYDMIYPYVKGGVEKRVRELATRLSRRGHDVHLFGMKFWDGDDIIVLEGVTLHGVSRAKAVYTNGRRSIPAAVYFGISLPLPLARDRFDLIDCQQFPFFSCFSAKLVSVTQRTPLVITWHEVWGNYWYTYLGKAGIFGKFIEWLVSRLAFNTIAVSATTAGNLEKLRGPQKGQVIPNGVDIRKIRSIPCHGDTQDLIFVGRLIKEKRVDLLIQAIMVLIKAKPDCRLLVIGEGPEEEGIRNLVHRLTLENHVRMIGFCESHDEVIARMKSAKVCVLPSIREGFGITALEALACGIPVVTVDHPANAIRELITEQNGRLSSLSAEDLAEKIVEVLAQSPEMKSACIASAEPFDWDCIVPDLEKYYQSVVPTRN